MRAAVENLVTLFEQGTLSRGQLIQGLLAAVAPRDAANAGAEPTPSNPAFRGRSLNHVTLSVTDVERSKEFCSRMLGGTLLGPVDPTHGSPPGFLTLSETPSLSSTSAPGLAHTSLATGWSWPWNRPRS